MGFPWGGDKKDDKASTSKEEKRETGKSSEAAGPKVDISAPVDSKPEGLPAPSSLFEFGPTVTVGSEIMRGTCTGDDPDAILACTWHIEPAQGKPRDKVHTYRIEF